MVALIVARYFCWIGSSPIGAGPGGTVVLLALRFHGEVVDSGVWVPYWRVSLFQPKPLTRHVFATAGRASMSKGFGDRARRHSSLDLWESESHESGSISHLSDVKSWHSRCMTLESRFL